jgi:hypothetical protein
MLTTIECAGHPRDMGLAQGAAMRPAIRAEAQRLGLSLRRSRIPTLRGLTIGSLRGVGAGRELVRHFAHQAERIEGVAEGAGLPLDTVLDLHLRMRAGGDEGGLLARRATLRARTVGGGGGRKDALLERTLPRPQGDESGWLVRESRPAVGFRSIEITLPWLVTAVAGVNEGGLAVVGGPLLWARPGRDGNPSSLLLVQECLQRFEDLDGAIGWCTKRPVEGEESLVIADATGAVATVSVSGQTRRVQSGEGELHLEAGEPPQSGAGSTPLREGLPPVASNEAAGDEMRVLLDAGARRLQVDAPGQAIERTLAV